MAFVEMKNINKSFSGVPVLKNVDFSIEKGEVCALIGENGAGKSTLMKILLGIYTADSGEVVIDGKKGMFKNPGEALKNGLSMIHQEISLVHSVDVAENIWMGREKEFSKFGFVNIKERYKKTKELLDAYNIKLDPHAYPTNLSVAQLQLIELARAISYNPRLIIMDEPTSSLSEEEVEVLFNVVRKLRDGGTSVIFISHKLEEMFSICDRIVVLRDGELVGSRMVGDITMDELIQMIIGRTLDNLYPKEDVKIGDEVLRVENLTRAGQYYDVNFSVHAGEIVGFCGLMGAGRTETMTGVFGSEAKTGGNIYLNGKKVNIKRPSDAIKLGIGMVTEDRLRTGSFHKLEVVENSSMVKLPMKGGVIDKKQQTADCNKVVKDMNVALNNIRQPIMSLSGGNQQKVILGRWMLTSPKVLIFDEPTRGIDVGSKSEIYALISKLAAGGMAVILVSSEMGEILGLSDKVYVMKDGRIVFETATKTTSQEELISYAYGVK